MWAGQHHKCPKGPKGAVWSTGGTLEINESMIKTSSSSGSSNPCVFLCFLCHLLCFFCVVVQCFTGPCQESCLIHQINSFRHQQFHAISPLSPLRKSLAHLQRSEGSSYDLSSHVLAINDANVTQPSLGKVC